MNEFLNYITGEINYFTNKISAYFYFKKDSKQFKYKLKWRNIQKIKS